MKDFALEFIVSSMEGPDCINVNNYHPDKT